MSSDGAKNAPTRRREASCDLAWEIRATLL